MKEIVPRYLRDFKCIAGACRHSCCVGWEIDIDERSLENYRRVEGEFGKRLAENIAIEGESACFRLKEDERCPFLNEKGLCDIYTTLGEESLCQICTDHPRFYNEIADRRERGVGLCCEAACRLVLCQEKPLSFEASADDGEALCYDAFEEEIVKTRQALFDKIQSLESLEELTADCPESTDWCAVFGNLERLDPKWSEELAKWTNTKSALWKKPMPQFDKEFRNLICYFLYRHLPLAQDEIDLRARILFAYLSFRVIRTLCHLRAECTLEDLLELARMYSAEIEYSEENTEALLLLLEDHV